MAELPFMCDLLSLSKEKAKEFLDSFDTVLTDCDGVLWLGYQPIPGSMELISKLKNLGKRVFLLTNNCTSPRRKFVNYCLTQGLEVTEEDFVNPACVMASYLKGENCSKKVYLIGSAALKEHLTACGIQCVTDPGPQKEFHLWTELVEEANKLDPEVGAVIIDFDINANYLKFIRALFYLRNPNCHFLSGGQDLLVPVGGGFSILGPGTFAPVLAKASGRKPLCTGKPETQIVEYIKKIHPLNPERTLIIGDSLSQDILLGTKCGFQKMLVLSGASKLEDTKGDSTNLPHYYLPKLADWLQLL